MRRTPYVLYLLLVLGVLLACHTSAFALTKIPAWKVYADDGSYTFVPSKPFPASAVRIVFDGHDYLCYDLGE